FAQAASSLGEIERGYGMDNDSWNDAISPEWHPANAPRIADADGSLFGGLTDAGFGDSLSPNGAGAQLFYVTQGGWDAVNFNATQTNKGDAIAVANGDQ
ncbi:MAG: hypothetical protein ABW199_10870, partial [Caulobacterales bacterium]